MILLRCYTIKHFIERKFNFDDFFSFEQIRKSADRLYSTPRQVCAAKAEPIVTTLKTLI